jgi:translation initiation factor IF-2
MLMEVGIQVEKLGGDIQAIPISALKKQNLGQLTEALVLQAELLEIGADPTGPVEAVVVESKLDPHKGKLSTVIVQRGNNYAR